ncbi:T9SS type A sorting domain-containing protein [candidate division WOR-3 bacterium]|uniref:T9SS type A sorting domain-containing protein n=1 Tax=candidate division WOR-3 bacterium TaxID=2052148 RepID=A0A937XJQ0_UNCW3|nr:T9SS type A sorting domain-containing protein [candidate division WOR-3 bacterium]
MCPEYSPCPRKPLICVCLLLAGVLLAKPASPGAIVRLGAPMARPLAGAVEQSLWGLSPNGAAADMFPNDVGATSILPAPDIYSRFHDTVFPGGCVMNLGTQIQANIPVICIISDSATGARVYGPETAYVASLGPGDSRMVCFPSWIPPAEERRYFDTVATAFPGDQDTTNDWTYGRLTVSDWGMGHLSYNDGTFETRLTWLAGGEFAERFIAPGRPVTIESVAVWLSSTYDTTYDAQVRVYDVANSPLGFPGSQLGAWVGRLRTDTWPFLCKNYVHFEPPLVVDRDTLFVSYYQTSIRPNWPYLGLDTIGNTGHWNHWSRPKGGSWSQGEVGDCAIDVYFAGPLLDAAVDRIGYPPGQIEYNTNFKPQVIVKNAARCSCHDIPVTFCIIGNVGDTVYSCTASSGPLAAGETTAVTFAASVTPGPGEYTMTCIALLPGDEIPGNDMLTMPLVVNTPLFDASLEEIVVPPGRVEPNTTLNPKIVVRNNAVYDCNDIPARLCILTTAGDTIYASTAGSGPVQSGQSGVVTFPDSITPSLGYYTITGITLLPCDINPGNDTLVGQFEVMYPRFGVEASAVDSIYFTITPNPLGRFAAARHSLPKAGFLALVFYDATGQKVHSQVIAAGRVGTTVIDLRVLKAGVYVVKVKANGFCTTQKLVIGRWP